MNNILPKRQLKQNQWSYTEIIHLYCMQTCTGWVSHFWIQNQNSEVRTTMDYGSKNVAQSSQYNSASLHIIYLTCKLKQNLLNCLSKPSNFISCDVKVRKNRFWRMKKQLLTGFRLELAAFGNIGKVSGSGISQFSPLKYILRGNAHPLLNVNDSESFSRRICVVTEPTWFSPACSSSSL